MTGRYRSWCILALLMAFALIPNAARGDVRYVYDGAGRLIAAIDPTGDTATYNYDAVGNLLSIPAVSSN